MSEEKKPLVANNPILLDKLPSGIKGELEGLKRAYGDYVPSMAIRHWTEIPRNQGSKSQWTVDGYATSRQFACAIAEPLFKTDGKVREVWLLRDGLNHPGPEILDFCHSDYGSTFPHSLPAASDDSIASMRAFSEVWVKAYYGIDPSNEQYVKVEDCQIDTLQNHLAKCRLTFSETGEQVTLLWRRGRKPFIITLRYPGQGGFMSEQG